MTEQKMDAETRALSRSPVFQELNAEGRASAAEGTLTLEELERRRPTSPEDREFAAAYGRALDLLEQAQGSEVTDAQGRTLRAVLSAVDHRRGRGTVQRLARDAG